MAIDPQPSTTDDRLAQAIAEYLEEVEAGRTPDRSVFLARHPELADELAAYFADQDRFDQLAGPLRAMLPGSAGAWQAATLGGDDTLHLVPEAKDGTLGDYELLECLAHGGMGVVYKARQKSLDRIVALKLILTGRLASATDVRRFRQEAQNVARLDHPWIVPIYEVGEIEGRHYFTMRLVEGGNLVRHLPRLLRDHRTSARVLADVARTIHYAHQRGILHRDIKPANILLDVHGQPHVTDFGLAQLLERRAESATTSGITGTPSYMAPEQAAGKQRPTTAADVYGLGAVLYELLTGRPPFRGDTPLDTLLMVMQQEPVPPQLLGVQVDRDLATICLKCLEKDPQLRYGSAEALADDLQRWLDGRPIEARPTGHTERAVKWARRHPLPAALVAVSVLAAFTLVGSIVGWSYGEQLQAKNDDLVAALEKAQTSQQAEAEQRQQTEAARKEAERSLEEARFAFYLNRIASANQSLADNSVAEAQTLLESCPWDLRDWEWRILARRSEGSVLTLRGHTLPATSLAYSPDGTKLASASMDQTVCVWSIVDGRLLFTLRGHVGAVSCVAFNRDGSLLATAGSDQTVRIWNGSDGHELRVLRGHDDRVNCVAFSPEGERVASAGDDRTVKLWDPATGRPLATLSGHDDIVWSVAFSPNGRWLASAGGGKEGKIKIWKVADGAERRTLSGHDGLTHVGYSADGRTLVSRSSDRSVRFWDAETGITKADAKGVSAEGAAVLNPAGTRLAYGGANNTVNIWDSDANETKSFRGHTATVTCAVFSPDGRQLASAGDDGQVKIWNAEAGHQPRIFSTGFRSRGFDFSPNGRRIALGGADGHVKIVSLLTGQELLDVAAHSGAVNAVAFSLPDGARLITAADDPIVRLWDAATGQELRSFLGWGPVAAVAFSADGRRVAAAGVQQTGWLASWNAATGRNLAAVRALPTDLQSLAFDAGARTLLGAGRERPIAIVAADGDEPLRELEGFRGAVQCLAVSSDRKYVAAAGGDVNRGAIKLWNAETGEELPTLSGHALAVRALAFSRDHRRLASAGSDGSVRLWDIDSGQECLTLRGPAGEIVALGFSPQDGRYLVSTAADGAVTVWDAGPPPEVRSLRLHHGRIHGLAFTGEPARLASAGEDQAIKLIHPQTGQEVRTLRGHAGTVWSLVADPSGQRFASAGDDGTVKIWDGDSGRELRTLRGFAPGRIHLAFSPDGRRLAASDGKRVRIFDGYSGDETGTPLVRDAVVTALAFSLDGERVAAGDATGRIKIWDARSGGGVQTLRMHAAAVAALVFSPDRRTMASGGLDGTAKLWSMADGRVLFTGRHFHPVTSLAFQPGGRQLASAGGDGAVRLWDTASGKEIATFRGRTAYSLAFHPDGRRLATGGDGVIEVWELEAETGK